MTENNQIETSKFRELYSIVALLFFAPIVNYVLEPKNLTENDIKIINTYKKAWYFVWFLVLIVIVSLILFLKFNYDILGYIAYWTIIFIVIYIFWNIKLIFTGKAALLFSSKELQKIEIKSVKAGKIDYILLYLPFINEYLFQTKKYTQEQAYWLKESVFLYFILGIIGVISIFFPNFISIFFMIVFLIIGRSVSLFFWIDIVPDNVKAIIYNSFEKRSIELFAYICAAIKTIFYNILLLVSGKKTNNYGYYLHKAKDFLQKEYEIKSILKKPKKYLSIILAYLLITIFVAYLIYKSFYSFNPYLYLFSTILFASYIYLASYITKKLYNLPIISGILSKILKAFN